MAFQLSNVLGEDMLTMLDRDRGSGVVMDTNYEISQVINIHDDFPPNGHEFNVVDGGKSVLYIKNRKTESPEAEKEAVGFHGDFCYAGYLTFHEVSTETWETTYEFDSWGKIRLNESTINDEPIEKLCKNFDFLHGNSVDKTPDGDYLFSGRHTDTIYKISKDDGHIVWRLGGKRSDFELGEGVKFSRQHNIRSQGQNETHTLISVLDNAVGQDSQRATHDWSRGLLIALRTDTDPMTAELVQGFDHPREKYADRRGNFQMLDNGNVFMGWSERAEQSEHAPDGKLLFEARFKADWMGSYRNYKFPYVGRPLGKPDVVSKATFWNEENEPNPYTQVWVSWNGDTEVRTWELHGSKSDNDTMALLDSVKRTGFEAFFEYQGYAKFVQLKGIDKNGDLVGDSGLVKTEMHPTFPDEPEKDEDDEGLSDDQHDIGASHVHVKKIIFIVLFVVGFVGAAIVVLTWVGIIPIAWAKQARERYAPKFRDAMNVIQYKKIAVEDPEQGERLVESKGSLPAQEPG
ncbi:hypothetical protein LTR37_017264 [Vermiconidia calcicola]|uniref:Uncharacterized protein n=1 Tax=Vermiconidia calcicola TaxID=1690605 RepID=A0ACC3MM12_9PEZI|nr:hypothetical protein LTR37_017264 [Vermiconidia calcicola]